MIKKLVEDLRNKHHQHSPDESPANASFKKETDHLQEDNKNKTEIIKILSKQTNTDKRNKQPIQTKFTKKQVPYTKPPLTTICSFEKIHHQLTAKLINKKGALDTTSLLIGKRVIPFLSSVVAW